MRVINTNILSAIDTTSQNGVKIDSSQLLQASFQAIFADATAAGTVKIQASNDINTAGAFNAANFTPTNWSDIPSAVATVASGVCPLITLANMSFGWIRAVYTRTSGGSTTVNVVMFAVGI